MVLGPKLFVLYIHYICKVSKVLNMVLFADDTNLYCSGKSLEQLLNTVELELRCSAGIRPVKFFHTD